MKHYELQISEEGQRGETQNYRLVWVAKFYSCALQDCVWLVLSYPFNLDDELSYLRTKERLRLRRRGRAGWRIWPYPFTPPDGHAYFTFPGQRLIQEGPEKHPDRPHQSNQ